MTKLLVAFRNFAKALKSVTTYKTRDLCVGEAHEVVTTVQLTGSPGNQTKM